MQSLKKLEKIAKVCFFFWKKIAEISSVGYFFVTSDLFVNIHVTLREQIKSKAQLYVYWNLVKKMIQNYLKKHGFFHNFH